MLRYLIHGVIAFALMGMMPWGESLAFAHHQHSWVTQVPKETLPWTLTMNQGVHQALLIAEDEPIEECGDSDGDGNCDSEAETNSES